MKMFFILYIYLSLFFLYKSKSLFLNLTNIRNINDKIIDTKNIDKNILHDKRIEKIKRILEQEINTNEKENNITNKVNNTEINDKKKHKKNKNSGIGNYNYYFIHSCILCSICRIQIL